MTKTNKEITVADVYKMDEDALRAAGYVYHHESLRQGYIAKKWWSSGWKVEAYKGRFGEGFRLLTSQGSGSTRYCRVRYFIKQS